MKTRFTILALLLLGVAIARTPSMRLHDDEKPTNLKVLPADISEEELHNTMRLYSKALGVRCTYCHVGTPGDPKSFDFAADTKESKLIARDMIRMTIDINEKYLAGIGKGNFEKITCVSCHNGHEKPWISPDSLPKPPMPPGMQPGGAPAGGARPDSTQHH